MANKTIRMVRGRPITASRTAMRPSRPVKTSSNTSNDIERLVTQAPYPFKNPMGILSPVSTSSSSRASGNFAKDALRYGGRGTSVGVRNTNQTDYAAVGDRKPGGYNSINSGFPLSGNRRVAGSISLSKGPQAVNKAFAKDRSRKDIRGILGR